MAGSEEQDKDQKTEEATPRRREEARENGQVAMSTEMIAAMMLCAGMASLMFGGGSIAKAEGELATSTLIHLGDLGRSELDAAASAELIKSAMFGVLTPLVIVFLPVIAVGVLVGYGQVGMRITPKAVAFDLSKLDVVKGLKRMFGARAMMRTAMAALKVATIGTVMIAISWAQIGDVIRMGMTDLGPMMVGIGQVTMRSTAGALVAIIILALIDMTFQRYQHEKDLRMTKQEVKEENRITEGDPHVKARVRQIQREFATSRMMADVPKATVVVTNPTHYAVALRYERDLDGSPVSAPKVVAKGVDHVAQRIKEVACENGIVCYEDVRLARGLHAQVDIGQEIPEDLYAAVAEVLAYVYRLEGSLAAV